MTEDDQDQKPQEMVGYKIPPEQFRFKKGRSGNPSGRPRTKQRTGVDFASIFDEPIKVNVAGRERKMSPTEISIRQMLKRAIEKEDLRSIVHLIDQFLKYDAVDMTTEQVGGVVVIPKSMPMRMGVFLVTHYGLPPWTDRQKIEARNEYVATRSDEERAIDEIIGYADLEDEP